MQGGVQSLSRGELTDPEVQVTLTLSVARTQAAWHGQDLHWSYVLPCEAKWSIHQAFISCYLKPVATDNPYIWASEL